MPPGGLGQELVSAVAHHVPGLPALGGGRGGGGRGQGDEPAELGGGKVAAAVFLQVALGSAQGEGGGVEHGEELQRKGKASLQSEHNNLFVALSNLVASCSQLWIRPGYETRLLRLLLLLLLLLLLK